MRACTTRKSERAGGAGCAQSWTCELGWSVPCGVHRRTTAPGLAAPHPTLLCPTLLCPCRRPERDPLPDVKDAKVAVAQALGRMAAAQPGRVPQLVAAALAPEQQQALAGYCQNAGVTIA